MSKLIALLSLLIIVSSSLSYSQQRPDSKKIKISGKIFEKGTDFPLEYATVVFENTNKSGALSGGVTDLNGDFNFEINSGTYNVRFEFISFKTFEIKNRTFNEDTNFGTIFLEADVAQLQGVELIAEKSTVEIKLDKRVYNVGKDMMV